MMRRKLLTGCVLASMVLMCACQKETDNNRTATVQTVAKKQMETTIAEVTGNTEAATSENGSGTELTEERLKWLVDESIYCNLKLFGMGNLVLDEELINHEGRELRLVKEEKFPDYATFEEYVRSVFCKETADMYLYNFPYEGEAEYVNVDGKLYVDTALLGAKGYYVDWSEYTMEIKSQAQDRCEFTVTASMEEPAEVPKKEPYVVEAVAVLEDGRWLLEKMLY